MTTEKTAAFAFGDDAWPGVAKLAEECGEVIQVIGKLLMTHGQRAHWSGDLRDMLLEEVADVEAAIVFFIRHNLTYDDRRAMARRVTAKVAKFEAWHADPEDDPPPASGIVAATAGETGGLDERSEQSPVGAAETPND